MNLEEQLTVLLAKNTALRLALDAFITEERRFSKSLVAIKKLIKESSSRRHAGRKE